MKSVLPAIADGSCLCADVESIIRHRRAELKENQCITLSFLVVTITRKCINATPLPVPTVPMNFGLSDRLDSTYIKDGQLSICNASSIHLLVGNQMISKVVDLEAATGRATIPTCQPLRLNRLSSWQMTPLSADPVQAFQLKVQTMRLP